MFSTVCEGLRYTLTCIINQDAVSLIYTIVDTGAFWTCYKVSEISEELTEDQFLDKETFEIREIEESTIEEWWECGFPVNVLALYTIMLGCGYLL